jgi:hypothetical protein
MDSAVATEKVIASVGETTWFIILSNTRITYFVRGDHKKVEK